MVNPQKSSIFFSSKIFATRQREILRFTSFLVWFFPIRYLRVPVYTGCIKATYYFEDLLQKIQKKVDGWKKRCLSAGTRLILLRHVLSSLPVQLLFVMKVPKQFIPWLIVYSTISFRIILRVSPRTNRKVGSQCVNWWMKEEWAFVILRKFTNLYRSSLLGQSLSPNMLK